MLNISNQIFDVYPSVDLLQVLARGSLRQNLPKAVRLWVILRSIYGDEADPIRLPLDEKFTYSDWNKLFFITTEKEHKDYKIPTNHNALCPCAKTIRDWLFDATIGCHPQEWERLFLQLYPMSSLELNSLLSTGIINIQGGKNNKQNPLPEGRLFGITSKTILNDFKSLVEMNWLQGEEKKSTNIYSRVKKFPDFNKQSEINVTEISEIKINNVIQNPLADFFNDFGQEINGQQRFFLDIEYIIHRNLARKIEFLRQQLKEIWHQQPIPPLTINYVSAKNFQNYQDEGEEYIVYPVCIYYCYRAPYLFCFGQTPENHGKIGWYDYRLDRIKNLKVLEWSKIKIPDFSQEICQTKTPGKIADLRGEAWGFDFYKPKKLMLLRFDRYFHNRYIEGTERDEIFTKIPYKYAETLISQESINLEIKQQALGILKSRSPQDIYCRVNYRADDNNVIMRLRAWGYKVEVLLPWDLRSLMAKEIEENWKLYQNKNN